MNDWSGKPKRRLTPMSELVDSVIGDVLRRTGAAAHHVIWTEWAEIAGKEWLGSTPVRLEGDTLWVAVPDAGSATRLRYATKDLLARIAARAGDGSVTRVRVKVSRKTGPR
jgi:hypothetical protein